MDAGAGVVHSLTYICMPSCMVWLVECVVGAYAQLQHIKSKETRQSLLYFVCKALLSLQSHAACALPDELAKVHQAARLNLGKIHQCRELAFA
jgi:hypothetical protein